MLEQFKNFNVNESAERDQNGDKLPRQAKKKSEQNRNKAIADIIFENILSAAVCFDTSKLVSCVK